MIFHIVGTKCAGKSHLIGLAREHLGLSNTAWWDIEKFYKKYGILKKGEIDWKEWQRKKGRMPAEMLTFIHRHKDLTVFVETSGINKILNSALARKDHLLIQLKTPPEDELRRRAYERETSVRKMMKFRETYLARTDISGHTTEEVLELIYSYTLCAICKEPLDWRGICRSCYTNELGRGE